MAASTIRRRPRVWAGLLLGFAPGGFFDGILMLAEVSREAFVPAGMEEFTTKQSAADRRDATRNRISVRSGSCRRWASEAGLIPSGAVGQ